MKTLKKRLFAFTILVSLTHMPFSCTVDCGPFELLESTITEINAVVGTNDDGNFQEKASSNYAEASVRVFISDMDLSELTLQNFNLINTAMACSPPEPEPTQKINKIEISSDKIIYTQGKTFEVGTDLTELFEVTDYYGRKSVSDFVTDQNSDLLLFGYFGAGVMFQLANQPDSVVDQAFTFQFEFSDGKVLNAEVDRFFVENE